MYIYSGQAGIGRNLYKTVTNGKIVIENEAGISTYIVERDTFTKEIVVSKNKKNKTIDTIVWGSKRVVRENREIIKQENYTPGSLQKMCKSGLFSFEKLTLWGEKGTLRRYTSGGAIARESFTYDNGRVAYDIKKRNKELRVVDSKGKQRVYVGCNVYIARWNNVFSKLNANSDNFTVGEGSYEVEIRDKQLLIVTKGRYENRQKVGKWVENKKEVYYLNGVVVEKRLFNAKPEEIKPEDILDTDNAQMRMALLNKMGIELFMKKAKGKVIDKDGDNELLIFPLKYRLSEPQSWNNNAIVPLTDTQLVILKVKCPSTGQNYLLRVPPIMTRCEEARQWTFGIEQSRDATEPRTPYIELEQET